jgi:nicotinate-nucleotide adenylyltransferase
VAGVGLLGGTFNPPHLGHLAVARHAREELGLEQLLLIPAHVSPYKPSARDPGPEHRLRMCRLATNGEPGLSVSAIEIERGGSSFTVDTLRAIRATHPDAELTLIMGADTARTLPAWREPGAILELAAVAVAARTGSATREVLETLTEVSGRAGVRFLEMPPIELSSSLVRERVARREPVEQLVGSAVARYIEQHGLYRSAEGAAG